MNPLKQGLKPPFAICTISLKKVKEVNPLKQGLKLKIDKGNYGDGKS